MSLSLFHNQSYHSLGWWHHCLSATHVGSLLWPVLGARRHPLVWLLFHWSLAREFRQVCIPDRMAKVMVPVWDTFDIYFSAMSDLAAPVSSRVWTCYPAISSYIQNGDSTATIGPLTSRQFFVGAVVGVLVHRPLRICLRGPQYYLRSLVCSKVLTHLGACSCAGLLLIHAGL